MLTDEQLEVFFNETINEKNFPIFAALANLENKDNYRLVIEALYNRKVNLFDISNLLFIDDRGIKELLDKLNIYNMPQYTSLNTLTPVNSYSFFNNNEGTLFGQFLSNYNNWMNLNFDKIENNVNTISLYHLDYNKSIYKNFEDFNLDFEKLVLQPLLSEMNISNVSSILPTLFNNLESDSNFSHSSEKRILLDIKTIINEIIISNITNVKLVDYFISNETRPSVIENNISFITTIFNHEKFSRSTTSLFNSDIFNFSNRDNLDFTNQEIQELWQTTLSTINVNGDYNFNELLHYLRYKSLLINFIQTKTVGTVSDNFINYLNELEEWLVKYIEFHNKLNKLITSKLDVIIIL
ncbi:MAG: hypothetical protein [Bacteriophage sp.]|nr:MAG: hypothetical protein [Bacteriophage sp.]